MIRRPPRSTLFPYTTLFRSPVTATFLPAAVGSDVIEHRGNTFEAPRDHVGQPGILVEQRECSQSEARVADAGPVAFIDRKSTRLNSSHANISYAVFCLKKKK